MQNDSREPPEEAPDASFADILKEFEAAERRAPSGGPRRGTVVGISGDYVLIDYGSKGGRIIQSSELFSLDGKLTVKPADLFKMLVTGRKNQCIATPYSVSVSRPSTLDRL